MPEKSKKSWTYAQKRRLLEKLSSAYPEPESELHFQNEYQLLVAVMLSAQCTDKKVNEVTPELFAKCPDFLALSIARVSALEKIIRQVNYYRTKAKHLQLMAKKVIDEFQGEVPRSMDSLTSLPGVGRKTANVVLGELQALHTLPVDTHVFRLAKRLGLSEGKNVRQPLNTGETFTIN